VQVRHVLQDLHPAVEGAPSDELHALIPFITNAHDCDLAERDWFGEAEHLGNERGGVVMVVPATLV
jgi:hypothetical protein